MVVGAQPALTRIRSFHGRVSDLVAKLGAPAPPTTASRASQRSTSSPTRSTRPAEARLVSRRQVHGPHRRHDGPATKTRVDNSSCPSPDHRRGPDGAPGPRDPRRQLDVDQRGHHALISAGLDDSLRLTIALTFIILLVAFGAIVASVVPLVLAVTALLAAFGLLGLFSQIVEPVSPNASQLVVLIGLAVAVDYSLFMITRFRPNDAAGPTRPRRSRSRAAPPAGRSSSPAWR